MSRSSEFVEFVVENLQALGPVYPKRMFGGHGIFMDGLMFGLITDDTLYLKADALNEAVFEEHGLAHFEYHRKDKLVRLSYRLAPESVFDDPDELVEWGGRSYAAARRSNPRAV